MQERRVPQGCHVIREGKRREERGEKPPWRENKKLNKF